MSYAVSVLIFWWSPLFVYLHHGSLVYPYSFMRIINTRYQNALFAYLGCPVDEKSSRKKGITIVSPLSESLYWRQRTYYVEDQVILYVLCFRASIFTYSTRLLIGLFRTGFVQSDNLLFRYPTSRNPFHQY